MPRSSTRGKDTILKWFQEHPNKIQKIIDVGCGEGTYPNLFKIRNDILKDAVWWGIEAWEPYIVEYELDSKYSKIFHQDARFFDWSSVAGFDLAIFGDILEHMNKEEAQKIVDLALQNVKNVLISIPIKHMPQGAVHGNPFEIHVKDNWSHSEVLDSFPYIIKSQAVKNIGVYWLRKETSV